MNNTIQIGSHSIPVKVEGARGCGYRKPGGIYLVAKGQARDCGRLPIPLTCCPTCNAGVKFTRGWTWINPIPFLEQSKCAFEGLRDSRSSCETCPLGARMEEEIRGQKVGLLWVGESFYKRPEDFLRESMSMGISRRISTVPHHFKIGQTWVWFAHKKAIRNDDGSFTPAVFSMFKPSAIEYIVKGTETEEELDKLVKRGLKLVKVVQKGEAEESSTTPVHVV